MPTSRLLRLPPELRNKIYNHILVQATPIEISERSSDPSKAAQGAIIHHSRLIEPAVLSTCRQIRAEGLPIFYGDNIFFTAIKDAIGPWLLAIGPEKTALIRNVWGFRPSTYFNYKGARSWAEVVERAFGRSECMLKEGVFRMPFGHEEFPGRVFWVGSQSDVVLATKEGCIELAREAFQVVEEVGGGLRLVPVRWSSV